MSGGRVLHERRGAVAYVTFDRPEARNAMTPAMYDELAALCQSFDTDADLRAVVMRGSGGKSFVSGSDIAQFTEFTSGDDGLVYERKMDVYLEQVARIPVPTIAVIEGFAVGGGLGIASACDLRIATTGSRFGAPIARTLGNCMSMRNSARVLGGFGEARTKRMLLLGELLGAEEALESGFLARLVAPEALDAEVEAMVAQIVANAPLTLRASKEAIRLLNERPLPDGDDIIRQIYGSADFKNGVDAFLNKTKVEWTGR